jgi:hypothetical protein
MSNQTLLSSSSSTSNDFTTSSTILPEFKELKNDKMPQDDSSLEVEQIMQVIACFQRTSIGNSIRSELYLTESKTSDHFKFISITLHDNGRNFANVHDTMNQTLMGSAKTLPVFWIPKFFALGKCDLLSRILALVLFSRRSRLQFRGNKIKDIYLATGDADLKKSTILNVKYTDGIDSGENKNGSAHTLVVIEVLDDHQQPKFFTLDLSAAQYDVLSHKDGAFFHVDQLIKQNESSSFYVTKENNYFQVHVDKIKRIDVSKTVLIFRELNQISIGIQTFKELKEYATRMCVF